MPIEYLPLENEKYSLIKRANRVKACKEIIDACTSTQLMDTPQRIASGRDNLISCCGRTIWSYTLHHSAATILHLIIREKRKPLD
jgi:hypothetical protein